MEPDATVTLPPNDGLGPQRTYATVCRLCLQKDGFMLGIFNHIRGAEKSICKKIVDCTALPVHRDDGLPNVICHRCLFKIEFCLEFRQLCFLSDATLRQLSQQSGDGQPPPRHFYEQLNGASEDNVVMVVDPNCMDYESEGDSDADDRHSDCDLIDGKNVSMCRFCDHAFTDQAECLEHENAAHNTEQPYNCSTCYMDFADRLLYSAHMKSVHKNDKPYNCPQCARTFARRSDLRKHTIVHTGVKPFTCPVCAKSFSRNTNLSKHMRIHSGTKPFVCQKCPRTFTSKGDLNRHVIIHTGQKPFRCAYCHLSFGRRDKLLRHERRHWPTRQSKMGGGGDKTSPERAERELQAMRDSLGYGFGAVTATATPTIDEETADGEDTNKQEENMVINLDPFSHNDYEDGGGNMTDGDGDSSPHNDDDDGDSFTKDDGEDDLPGVPDHIRAEVEDEADRGDGSFDGNGMKDGLKGPAFDLRPYHCEQCPKKFSTPDNLRYHQAIHSGARPFACHLCNKAFIRKRELDRHLTTHTGVKPFKCQKCFSCFGRKDKLVRHMRIHERHDREKYQMELKDSLEAYRARIAEREDVPQ